MAEGKHLEMMAPFRVSEPLARLIQDYFPGVELTIRRLKGDGSDRLIYRIYPCHRPQTAVVGVSFDQPQVNRDFCRVTQAFHATGIPAPEILAVNPAYRAYLLQDLGDETLADQVTAWRFRGEEKSIIDAYQTVISHLVWMQRRLLRSLSTFLKDRVLDRSLLIADIDYFQRDFIHRFRFDRLFTPRVQQEIDDGLIHPVSGLKADRFVYRDFQSRNIMWLAEKPWFIDYQSALRGAPHYDVASLLYGSKSGLDESMRASLLRRYHRLSASAEPFEAFEALFYRFVAIRRLRSLGTYGYLASVKAKPRFLDTIGPTLAELNGLFSQKPTLRAMPRLAEVLAEIQCQWPNRQVEHPIPPPC